MAGIFYGWIGFIMGTGPNGGYLGLSYQQYQEYHLLLTIPMNISPIFSMIPMKAVYQKFFDTTDSYWNDLKGNVFIKILSVFNIFSFGNYYINVIFYSFITLFGPIAIYRVMTDVFPGKKWLFCWLLSSFLLFYTGQAGFIKKD